MSKFVDQIIKELKEQPESFFDFCGNGVTKANLIVSGYGNTKMFSVIAVIISSRTIPTSYFDKWRLETAIKRWYANVSLEHLMNK